MMGDGKPVAAVNPVAITACNVSKVFGTRRALDDISLAVPEGAFLSIFGPNGAGKTTLLRVLATLARPTSGQVLIEGIDTKEEPDKARAMLGLISHAPMVYPDLSAEENLLFYAEMYGVANPQARVDELLDAVGLAHRRYDTVRTFSRGMTQRVAIARALVHDPRIVLLDEPYSGLDPHAVDVFDGLLADLRADRTIVMVSHDFRKGLDMCSHALMMARGRVVSLQAKSAIDPVAFEQLYRDTVGMGVS